MPGSSFASASSVVSGRGCSSHSIRSLRAARPGHVHRNELRIESAARRCGFAFHLRFERKAILRLRVEIAVTLGDLLGGLAERNRPLRRHLRIDHPPSRDRIVQLLLAAERRIAFGQHVRRARHRLDTACDHHVAFAEGDSLRGGVDRLKARSAQPVYGYARHLDRKSASSTAIRATLRLSSPL